MKLWGKYLISDENVDDWGDPVRHFEGVYTEKAMMEDINSYYHEGYKQCEKVIKGLNKELVSLATERESLIVQMEETLEDKFNTKQKRRKLQKEIEKLSWKIKNIRNEIEQYENGMEDKYFCINIGMKRCGIVYEEVEFFVTDYEREILERFCI